MRENFQSIRLFSPHKLGQSVTQSDEPTNKLRANGVRISQNNEQCTAFRLRTNIETAFESHPFPDLERKPNGHKPDSIPKNANPAASHASTKKMQTQQNRTRKRKTRGLPDVTATTQSRPM
jgi:hypothetical protein